jgi:hypothetical protein
MVCLPKIQSLVELPLNHENVFFLYDCEKRYENGGSINGTNK